MSLAVLLLLALGLSMDAVSASITDGMLLDKINFRRAVFIALALGLFLSAMPLAGFFAGNFLLEKFAFRLERYSEKIVPLFACALVCLMGLQMLAQGLAESLNKRTAKKIQSISPGMEMLKEKIREKMTPRLVISQAVAISIETLVVGLALAVLQANILYFSACTLSATSVLCFFGVFWGRRHGDSFTDKADFLGGLLLVALSVKLALPLVA